MSLRVINGGQSELSGREAAQQFGRGILPRIGQLAGAKTEVAHTDMLVRSLVDRVRTKEAYRHVDEVIAERLLLPTGIPATESSGVWPKETIVAVLVAKTGAVVWMAEKRQDSDIWMSAHAVVRDNQQAVEWSDVTFHEPIAFAGSLRKFYFGEMQAAGMVAEKIHTFHTENKGNGPQGGSTLDETTVEMVA